MISSPPKNDTAEKTLEPNPKASFFRFSFDEIESLLSKAHDQISTRGAHLNAHLLFNWYYKKNERRTCEKQELSRETQKFIEEFFSFEWPEIFSVHESTDNTVKFLFRLADGFQVESVVIPFQGKYSVCLSSQVGCAMKCSFCFTGTQGFTRNLRTEEIIGQFLQCKKWLSENRKNDDKITNVVFMGQGEPLQNFDAVKKSCEIFLSQSGLSLASQKITVSTSGFLPGIQRWKNEMPSVNLALSLHSPFEEKRNRLIPLNKKYPLPLVLESIDQIPLAEDRFITYEYLLVKNFNDRSEDAQALGTLLRGKKAYINLIPFNPFPSAQFERPEPSTVLEFKKNLEPFGIPTLIRKTKGSEILAACGQLNTKKSKTQETPEDQSH